MGAKAQHIQKNNFCSNTKVVCSIGSALLSLMCIPAARFRSTIHQEFKEQAAMSGKGGVHTWFLNLMLNMRADMMVTVRSMPESPSTHEKDASSPVRPNEVLSQVLECDIPIVLDQNGTIVNQSQIDESNLPVSAETRRLHLLTERRDDRNLNTINVGMHVASTSMETLVQGKPWKYKKQKKGVVAVSRAVKARRLRRLRKRMLQVWRNTSEAMDKATMRGLSKEMMLQLKKQPVICVPSDFRIVDGGIGSKFELWLRCCEAVKYQTDIRGFVRPFKHTLFYTLVKELFDGVCVENGILFSRSE